jgi:membrane protease YdiL (CAAX protease family)
VKRYAERRGGRSEHLWWGWPFWFALAAGPLVWGALFLVTAPQPDLLWPGRHPIAFLQVALLYPVLEELAFRGALQDACHRYLASRALGPISVANLVTSAAFTALHFLYHPLAWAASVFLPSLLFGHFKDRYHSLVPPILLHIFYNSGFYWLLTSK